MHPLRGLAFFLFGMHIMSQYLEKIAGGRLESTLKKMTSNPFKSLALGAVFEFSEKQAARVEEKEQRLDDMEDKLSDFLLELSAVSLTDRDGQSFTDVARRDLSTLFAALTEITDLTVKAFTSNDTDTAGQVEPLEEVIDGLTGAIRDKLIARLRRGECSPELGVYLSDHCSNVAVSIIQISKADLGSHTYLNTLRAQRTEQFMEALGAFERKYRLSA